MTTVVFRQFMEPKLACDFEDPIFKEVMPEELWQSLWSVFQVADTTMVTITWGDQGFTGTLLRYQEGQTLVSPEEAFTKHHTSPAQAKADMLRKAAKSMTREAYALDEGLPSSVPQKYLPGGTL